MLLEDIVNILSKRGETKTYEMPFKAFNAGKTNIENHKELLFITKIENKKNKKNRKNEENNRSNNSIKNDIKNIFRSPFFYVGDKYKLMSQIVEFFPKKY